MSYFLWYSEAPGSIDGHSSRVFTCCFNPRSNHEFLSGGWDDVIYYWDLRQPHAIRHLSGVHICGDGIDINAKGTEVNEFNSIVTGYLLLSENFQILSCSYQKQQPLKVWDYASGKLMAALEPDIYESMVVLEFFVVSWIDDNIGFSCIVEISSTKIFLFVVVLTLTLYAL